MGVWERSHQASTHAVLIKDLDDDHVVKISSSNSTSIITSNNSNCIINFDENKTQDKVVYFN